MKHADFLHKAFHTDSVLRTLTGPWTLCLGAILVLLLFFWQVVGLCYCTWAFPSSGSRSSFLVEVHGLLFAVAPLAAEHRLLAQASVAVAHGLHSCSSQARERRLSSCGAWAQLLCSMWNLPRPGVKRIFPALAGEFLSTAPLGKSPAALSKITVSGVLWTRLCIVSYRYGLLLSVF